MLQQTIFKWLMVLFVGELPLETEYLIWDLFMIKGSVVIFRVALTILKLMQNAIMDKLTYDNIITVLTTFGKQISCKSLMKNLVAGASNTQIS
jgi:hypothetical protein